MIEVDARGNYGPWRKGRPLLETGKRTQGRPNGVRQRDESVGFSQNPLFDPLRQSKSHATNIPVPGIAILLRLETPGVEQEGNPQTLLDSPRNGARHVRARVQQIKGAAAMVLHDAQDAMHDVEQRRRQ